MTQTPSADAGDISARTIWIGCIALYAIYMVVAVFWIDILRGPGLHPVTGEPNWELGLLETTQNIFLAIALVMAGVMCARAKTPLLRVWLAVVFIGVLYLLGEETSWGQHYFRWGTGGWFAEFNDQSETNLHNTSYWLDQAPRNLLYLGMVVGGLIHPLLKHVRKGRGLIDKPWWWAPTIACLPAVLFAFISGAPKGLDKIANDIAALPNHPAFFNAWNEGFALQFYRASEMEECFMYLFFVVYLWSLASRLKFRSEKDG